MSQVSCKKLFQCKTSTGLDKQKGVMKRAACRRPRKSQWSTSTVDHPDLFFWSKSTTDLFYWSTSTVDCQRVFLVPNCLSTDAKYIF